LPTGYTEESALRTILKVITSTAFLIGSAIVVVVLAIYFNLTSWWVWAIAPSAATLAVMAILLKKRDKNKSLVSKRQATQCNDFDYYKEFTGNKYTSKIDATSKRSPEDCALRTTLFRQLVETFVELELYEKIGGSRCKALTGREIRLIKPVEFYTDFVLSAGVGYILLMPSVSLMSKAADVDAKIVSCTLRDIGLLNWGVECVEYGDGIKLFLLSDDEKRYAELCANFE
jgi:hypothetical protein